MNVSKAKKLLSCLSIVALSVSFCLLLPGCSGDKVSVKKALSEFVSKSSPALGPLFNKDSKGSFTHTCRATTGGLLHPEEALVNSGLLSVKTMHNSTWNSDSLVYTVTSQGMKYLNASGQIVYAHYKLQSLDTLDIKTEKGLGLELTRAHCGFTYTVENIAPWAKNKEILQAYPEVLKLKYLTGNLTDTASMEKGTAGWIPSMFTMFPKNTQGWGA